MSQFSADMKVNGNETTVVLSGHVDEDATFSNIDLTKATQVAVELEGITAINSCGIREWIKWIRSAPTNSKIIFRNCPKVIIDQINMVSGFLPENATVESFYVPYYSDETGNEKMVLFRQGVEFKNGELFPPDAVKDDSGVEMEMDVIEAKYFKFLQK